MRPVSNLFFGNSLGVNWGMKIQFHNGSTVVDGYIVKQLGTNQFVVSDGTTNYIRNMSQDGIVSAGLMTIIIKKIINYAAIGADEHVLKFLGNRKVLTVEGNIYKFAIIVSPYYPNVPSIDPGNYGGIAPWAP